MSVSKPVEFWIAENERLRKQLDRANELLYLSAGVNLKLIDEYIKDEKLKLRKSK